MASPLAPASLADDYVDEDHRCSCCGMAEVANTGDECEACQLTPYQKGQMAFEEGVDRIVPRGILVNQGTEAAKEWYRGWDQANLAAPWDV